MDAKTNIKARLPSRHVTEGPAPAAHFPAVALVGPFGAAEVFKRTPYVPDLKPAGRHVAKDMFEEDGIPLLMKDLLDHGYLHGACITVPSRTIAENMKSVQLNSDQAVVRPADQPVTATGGAPETQ